MNTPTKHGGTCHVCPNKLGRHTYKIGEILVCSLRCRGEASRREVERKTGEATRAGDIAKAAAVVAGFWNNSRHIFDDAAKTMLKHDYPELAAAIENLARLYK